MQIKKSELRSVIKEQVTAFFVTPQPFGTVSRNTNLAGSLRKFDTKDVDEKELIKVIKQTMSELEEEATKRMKSSKLKEARVVGKAKGHDARVKEVEQHWMTKFESILKRKAPKLVGRVEEERAQYMQTMGYSPEDAVRDIIKPGSLERSNHNEIQKSKYAKTMIAEAKKKPAKWYDAIKRPVKVGDKVHVGHAQKGGAGVEGKVTKIAGNVVYIKNDAGKTYKGPLKNTAIMEISGVDSLKPNDPHTPEDEAEKDAADDVMEASPKKKGGRPRGASHIENLRFWDMSETQLKYIIKDAGQAVQLNPTARKANKWADEINDAVTVLYWRKKKGIKEEYIQLVVTEGFKKGTKISKALAQSSTIKIANPKDPRWIFAIVSRFGSKGVTSAAAQDKVSMVVVDKAGKVIKDWGSHINAKAALGFAQSRGYTKKIDESQSVTEAEKEGKKITALRKIVKTHTAGKIGGQTVDAFTAGGLVKLYDKLSEKNRPKFEKLSLPKLVDFMWKQMQWKIKESVMEAAAEGKRITALRKIVKTQKPGRVDRQWLDLYNASDLVKLYDGLPGKKGHLWFEQQPIGKLMEFLMKVWRKGLA